MKKNHFYKKLYRQWLRNKATNRIVQEQFDRKKAEPHIQAMVIIFFVGLIFIAIYGEKTLISWNTVAVVYIICVFVLSFLPVRWYPIPYRLKRELKALMIYFSLAPFLTGLFLLLNFVITTDKWQQTYKVTSYSIIHEDKIIEVYLENADEISHFQLRRYSTKMYNFAPDSVVYEVHKGIFKVKVIKDITPIRKKE